MKTTQSLLLKLITAPEGVEKALQESPGTVLPIRGDSLLSSVERLDIYANMYFYRIRDSLKEDFPAVLKILGKIGFHNLITEYLFVSPSTHYSLRYAGQHLPRYLKRHRLLKKYPYLAELAELEWALLNAFDAPNSKVLAKEDLKAVTPEEWSHLRFHFIPSIQVFEFSYPVGQIRDRALRGKKVPSFRKKKTRLLVWRRNFKVCFRDTDELESKILYRLGQETFFGDLCHRLSRRPGGKSAPIILARYLQTWIREGLLAEISLPSHS